MAWDIWTNLSKYSEFKQIIYIQCSLQCRIQMYFGTAWMARAPQKNMPIKILVTLPYIFHVKIKLSIVYEYLKIKIFSRDTNILPQMHWTSNIFGHSPAVMEGFLVSLNYPIINFKKKVCRKKVWMRHWPMLTKIIRNP